MQASASTAGVANAHVQPRMYTIAEILPVILGSSATSRRAVLEAADIPFVTMSPDIDEKAHRHEDPMVLPLVVAKAKAAALLDKARARFPSGALLITADQVVLGPGGDPREKPESDAEAEAFTRSYAGASARTVSAVVATNTLTGAQAGAVHVTAVHLGPGLAEGGNVAAVLQPGVPVPLPVLYSKIQQAAGAKPDTLCYGAHDWHGRLTTNTTTTAAAAGGGSGGDGAGQVHAPPPAAPGLVSIKDCAGGLCIEHPAVAPHITRIVAEPVAVGAGAGADAAASSSSLSPPTWLGLDSVHGLPWGTMQALVRQVAPKHPLGGGRQ